MTIHIEDLSFQCIIGILDFERTKPQNVIINLELDYEFDDEFINYATLSEFIKSTMIQNEFSLIEDALSVLSDLLKKKFTQIKTLRLKITKPSIMLDCKVSVSNLYTFVS